MSKDTKSLLQWSARVFVILILLLGLFYEYSYAEVPEPKLIDVLNPVSENSVGDYVYLDIPLSKFMQRYIQDQSKKEGIDYSLVLAVIRQESNFTADVISASNDYGLMQINKCNHSHLKEKLGINDFLDPMQNVDAGIWMLKYLIDKYDDLHQVLMAYNFGEGGMLNTIRKGYTYSEYSQSVVEFKYYYEKELDKARK